MKEHRRLLRLPNYQVRARSVAVLMRLVQKPYRLCCAETLTSQFDKSRCFLSVTDKAMLFHHDELPLEEVTDARKSTCQELASHSKCLSPSITAIWRALYRFAAQHSLRLAVEHQVLRRSMPSTISQVPSCLITIIDPSPNTSKQLWLRACHAWSSGS